MSPADRTLVQTFFQRNNRRFFYCRLIVLLMPVFFWGCFGSGTESGDYSRSDAHAAPPHYPQNFAVAVSRIQNLVDSVSRGELVSEFTAPEKVTNSKAPENTFAELLDLVEWLPDLAAASDLGEGDWLICRRVSQDLLEKLDTVKAVNPERYAEKLRELAPQLHDSIEKLKLVVVEFQRLEERYRPQEVDSSENQNVAPDEDK